MKTLRNLFFTTAIFSALSVGHANALPVTIDFSTAANSATSSLTFSNGGITVIATAGSPTGLVNTRVNAGDKNKGGLGVTAEPGDNGAIDGFGFVDLLNLVFNKKVKIISARFSEVDKHDDYSFYTSAGLQWTRDLPYNFFVNNFGGAQGTEFGFGALAFDDDYRLRSITVSPVPLPASLLLLLTGIAGVGALGRRKAKIS